MERIARRALSSWSLERAEITLVAQRENVVFEIRHGAERYALRLHRPGYQSDQMVLSELRWMKYLLSEGLTVPAPVAARSGGYLVAVDGHQADLLTWLSGTPMGATGTPLDLKDRHGTFRSLGEVMARMHQISDEWEMPDGFERKHWDLDGLLGESPIWGRFWENPALASKERDMLSAAREALKAELTGKQLDFGLIHADMLRENVMIDGDNLGLIDFDDSGFGYRLFDVATTLLKNASEPDFDQLQDAFLEGYQSIRPLDTGMLPQFMLIRALTYLGWIITRMDEPGAKARQARFLASALPMAEAYLSGADLPSGV